MFWPCHVATAPLTCQAPCPRPPLGPWPFSDGSGIRKKVQPGNSPETGKPEGPNPKSTGGAKPENREGQTRNSAPGPNPKNPRSETRKPRETKPETTSTASTTTTATASMTTATTATTSAATTGSLLCSHSFACLLLFLFLLGREEGEVGEEEEGVESNPIPRIFWIGAGRLVARPARRRGGPSADPSNPRGPPRV